MQRKVLYRLLVILVVLAASVYFFVPLDQKIRLGLDLKGGMHLVLQVVTDEALEAEVSQTVDRLNSDLKDKGIPGSAAMSGLDILISAVPQDKDGDLRALLDSDYA